jgi:hypothetical protein
VTRTRLRSLAGLAIVSTFLLTGCGSVPAFNPGVAVRVGDGTVTVDHVDDLAQSYCSAAEAQLTEGQVLPNHYVRGEVAGSLALRAVADKLLDDYDVEADDSYDQAVDQAKDSPQLTALPADQQDALIEVQGASIYVSAVELAVGRQVLADAGQANPSDDDAATAGRKTFETWVDDHDIRIDPRFGVAIAKDQSVVSNTGLSFASGDTATKADAKTPDSVYAATLPDSQRCG